MYDVTEGSILLDGINLKSYSKKELLKRLGYVPQTASLFSGTILDNVKFGYEEATQEDIDLGLEVACAKDFVYKLPDGLNSIVSQKGKNFSGGQKQRLSIARAIVKKPEILIFDDSFSALDYQTDSIVRKNLKSYLQGTTNIIVAQRIGTIMDADQIIVLDGGLISGIGTHSQLLKTNKIYKEIALSQLSQAELEEHEYDA
jgi:ABC-type multidrug transport system fused ATPase/permease subunit